MSSRSESKKAARERRQEAEREEAERQRRQRIWALAGGAALLVDPYDDDSIANGIVQAVTDEALRADLIARGKERARSFSWSQSVRKIHEIYMEVAKA